MNTLRQLEALGQSIWYDNISREVLRTGELQRMVDEGLLGVTSNPTIFDKAISGSSEYDAQIRALVGREPGISVARIIQELMADDIRNAADVLAPVYHRTSKRDGYVSIEVTPSKAHDTAATVAEARQLWQKVNRPNIMIKIPATKEGLPAVTETIGEGINVNVTLIFSVERYRQVTDAYLAGLERRKGMGKPVDHIASVASVFVSRIDTLVDDLLMKTIASASSRAGMVKGLFGKAAVANSKMIYTAFKEIVKSSRFLELQKLGATMQRPLWASTGTKNPAYSDLLYVDTLIASHTVNTVPPSTYAAILDHGKAELTAESNLEEAKNVLTDLKAAGIDMAWVLQKLEDDGVAAFEKSFDGLYANVSAKRASL